MKSTEFQDADRRKEEIIFSCIGMLYYCTVYISADLTIYSMYIVKVCGLWVAGLVYRQYKGQPIEVDPSDNEGLLTST